MMRLGDKDGGDVGAIDLVGRCFGGLGKVFESQGLLSSYLS